MGDSTGCEAGQRARRRELADSSKDR